MAYFDNASTTYPKPYCVYDFMGNRIGSRHQFDKKNEFETNLV